MAYDLKKEENVKEYLEKLGQEYRFGCFTEKKPESCNLLGDYLESKQDYDKAAKVYKNNCDDFSNARSCYKYATCLVTGKGAKKCNKQGLEYYEKGCIEGERSSCMNAGVMYVSQAESVKDIPQDYKKGIDLLQRACEEDHAYSCHYLTGMYIIGVENYLQKNMEKAFDLANKACSLGNMYGCANVAKMYAKGEGVSLNESKSEEFKEKALEIQGQMKSRQGIGFQHPH